MAFEAAVPVAVVEVRSDVVQSHWAGAVGGMHLLRSCWGWSECPG